MDDLIPAARKKILVVDDDPIVLRAVSLPLQKRGYYVATAESGEEAVDWLAEEAPDLVILDVIMPGLDGHGVCRILRANPATSHTPVIFLTARRGRDDMAAAHEAGSDLYLIKPVLPARLLNMVEIFLSSDVPLTRRRTEAPAP
jgi:DNA-binding response OmpR family regulator